MSFTQLENHSQLLCGHNFANGGNLFPRDLIIADQWKIFEIRDI